MSLLSLLSLLPFLLFSETLQATANNVYQLEYHNSKYYLNVNLGSQKASIKLAIDTSIPTSLINSIDCIICQNTEGNKYDASSSTSSELINPEITYKKMKHLYTGKEYKDRFEIKDVNKGEGLNGHLEFISTHNVSLITEVVGAGIISLSHFSDFINSHTKKIFVLVLGDKTGTVTVGELNPQEINITQLVYYPMTINDQDKLWYLASDKLTISRTGEETREYKDQKVMIDSSTWQFYIPKAFFYENIETILPMKCQISKNSLFYCTCLQQKQTLLFPTFNFIIGGHNISMGPEQYMNFDSSDGNCVAHFSINYYTDYWVIGINLLNEHSTIFDYENKRISFFDKAIISHKSQTSTFVTIFVSVFICSSLLFFGGYYVYKRYYPILN